MNTTVMILAGLGGFLWIVAMIRDSIKKTTNHSVWKRLFDYFVRKPDTEIVPNGVQESTSSPTSITIEALETELGITPDAYLCDRISRINEALVARRDGSKTKKGGTK
ncbi:MAG: hypothetical protein LBQ50_01245 [Planctomycetaceae bacterium]|jgi:hypothetical protein|nr:hypothetical protein [Planctomycetaceae bacterium]